MYVIKPHITELYVLHVSSYLDCMNKSTINNKLRNSNGNIYHGWKLITQIFMLLHSFKYSTQQIHHNITRSCTMYLEYIEKIHTKHMCEHHSPSTFVYKQIIGDSFLNNNKCNRNMFQIPMFIKVTKITELVLLWDNPHFTYMQRKLCVDSLLYQYIAILSHDKCYHLFRLLEILQTYWKNKNSYSQLHIRILHRFISCIETQNKFEYSIDIVKKQSFDKFITHSHILDELIVHTIHTNCVDELVAWIFDEIHDKSESLDAAIDS